MTLDDGDYELVLEQDQEFSEDSTNIAENLTETPNHRLEFSDTPARNPLKKASPGA
jgi:hypothetical protein